MNASDVNIYGSSQGYPWAGKPMHNVAAQLLRQHLGGDYTVDAEARLLLLRTKDLNNCRVLTSAHVVFLRRAKMRAHDDC